MLLQEKKGKSLDTLNFQLLYQGVIANCIIVNKIGEWDRIEIEEKYFKAEILNSLLEFDLL